jgi:UDP-glucuronate decarboxylase
VISNFIVQALRGEPLTIYGKGDQTRSFCYIDDLVEGLIRLMRSDPEISGPVNLGNPAEQTILQVAEQVNKACGNRSEIIFQGLPQDDPKRRCPDIGLANKLLDWSPTIGFRDGLEKTVRYFSDLLKTLP